MERSSNVSANSSVVGAPPESFEFVLNVIILQIYLPVIVVVGFFGNSITVLILSKRRNRISSTANFLLALAVSDNCILFVGAFSNWLHGTFGVNFRNMTGFGCKLHIYLSYVPISVSSWLLGLVTIERVISVVRPYKVKEWCTLLRTRIAIAVIVIVMALFYLHFLFGFENGFNENLGIACRARDDRYLHFLSFIMPYLDFSLTFLLPCAIIIPGNIIIIAKLARNRAHRKTLTSDPRNKDSSVTRTLVLAGVFFVFTVSPISIYLITLEHWVKVVENPWFIATFWRIVFNSLSDLNAAVNFFLYVLSGKKFRQEVKEMMTCRCAKHATVSTFGDAVDGPGSTKQGKRSIYTISSDRT